MALLGKTRTISRRLLAVLRRDRFETELAEEISHHLEQRRRQLVDGGMDPRDAAVEARRMFGNVTAIREETRDMWSIRWADTIAQDLRYGLRLMRRSPLVTVIAVVSLTVGIAASTIVTGVVNASLWRWSAMYAEPGRLVFLWQTREADILTPTPADFRDWRRLAKSFDSVEAYTYRAMTFSTTGDPEQVQAAAVTPGMFRTLGVVPVAGAGFLGPEETWGRHTRVLLSEGFWRRRFGADRAVLGRTLSLDGVPHEIAGVMPAGTWFSAARPDLFVPLAFAPDDPSNNRNSHFIWVIARLHDGVTVASAAAEMGIIARQLEAQHPANKGLGARPVPMAEQILGEPARTLAVVAGAVTLVLLIACVNVAGLLLVRTAARNRELAVRASLGATRLRVALQLATEGVMLAFTGGILGVAVAAAILRTLPTVLPANLPRIAETGIPIDWRVMSVAFVAVVGCGLVIGALPAFTGGRWRRERSMKEAPRGSSGAAQVRLRSGLISAEIGLSVILVIGAALLVRSFANLQRVDVGTRTTDLLTVRIPLPPERWRATNAAATSAYLDAIAERARTVPGVHAADITSHVPLAGGGQSKHFYVVGQTPPASYQEVPTVSLRQEGPDSLRAMGATLARGRFFAGTDRAGSNPVAIVNQTLARRFFGASNPVGQVVCLQAPEHLSPPDNVTAAGGSFVRWTIVGVVEDVRYTLPSQPMEAVVYVPYRQRTRQALMGWAPEYLVLHTSVGPDLLPALRERLREVAPAQPLAAPRTIEMLAADSLGGARVMALVLSLFSAVALFLAGVGVYGAVASAVGARTQEIGIRVALGAQPRGVVWLVLRQSAVVGTIGIVAGIAGALATKGIVGSQLHGVGPLDPLSFVAAVSLVAGATALASWIPARRAARIDPVTALRSS